MYKRFLFVTSILLILVVIINCATFTNEKQITKTSQIIKEKTEDINIEYLLDSTVAIYVKGDIGIDIYLTNCAGVWIDKNTILTAGHCVNDNIVYFETWRDSKGSNLLLITKKALLLKKDRERDLALLTSIEDPGHHKYVGVSNIIDVGDKVSVIGHPGIHPYSYLDGTVSAKRYIDNPFDTRVGLVQIAAPIWHGYSGGGAFNKNGKLIGICSFISPITPMTGFFIDIDEVNRFIGR